MGNKSYLVKWEIDIEASSPKEASRLALEIQRDKNSEAVCFDVKEVETGEEINVNLSTELDSVSLNPLVYEYLVESENEEGVIVTVEEMVQAIVEQAKIDDTKMIDHVDGVQTVEQFEYIFTCRDFLEII